MFKKTLEQGNSCFIDAKTQQPFAEQFQLLRNIKRISVFELDKFYQSLSTISNSAFQKFVDGKLTIVLNNDVRINREDDNSFDKLSERRIEFHKF